MDRNKIARELTSEELTAFLDKCWKTPGLTLKRVQDLAGEYGIEVSLMGAKSFRDTTFERHLQRIGKAAALAEQVSALRSAGAGHTIADAAAAIISDEVLEKLVNRDDDDELDLDVLSKIVSRLRAGDTQIASLKHRMEQDRFDAARAVMKHLGELKEIAGTKGLSDDDKLAKVRARLFGEAPV